jgi:DNA gyrase subunit A
VRFLPHEPGEVVEAIAAHLAGSTPPPLAPDFPTGGVLPDTTWRAIARDGRGSLRVHARTHVEERNGARLLVVTELPFLVDQREPIEQAARCMRDGRVTGMIDVLDESSREGMRLVFVLAPGADAAAVTAALLGHTSLAVTIEVESTAAVDGTPRIVCETELIERTASRLLARTRQRMPAADPSGVRDAVIADLRDLIAAHAGGRRTTAE